MKKRNHTVNSRLCSLVLALGLVSLLANVAGADVGFPNPRNDSAVAPGREFSVELRGSGTYTLQITEYDGVNPPSWLPQAPYGKTTAEPETHEWDSAVFSINPLPNWPYVSIADPRLPGPYAGLRENRVYRWRIYDGSSYYPDATGWTVHVPMCQPTDGSTRVGVYVRFLWNAHPDGLAGAQEKLLLRDMDADEVPDWVVTDTSGNITGINDDLVVKTYDPVNGTDQEKLREFWHFDPNYERLLPGRTYQWRIVYCDGDGNPLYDDASVDDIKDPGEEYFWADLRDDFAAGWEFTTVPEFSSAKLNESGTEALVVYWESMYGTLALDPEEKDYDFKGIAEDLVNIHENIHNPSIQTAMVGSEELTASYGGLNNDAANRADCTPQADWVPEITEFDGWYTMTRAERAATGPNETGGLSAKDDFVYGSQDRYEEWTARAIRTLLQDAAHAWNDPDGFGTNDKADAENLQYVILVGDADRVAPSFYFHYSSVAGGSTVHHWVPTDFFYSSQTKTPDVSTSPAYQVSRIPVGSKHYYRTEDTHGLPYEPDEPCIEKIHNYAALLNSDTNKETAYENWFGRAVVVSGSTEFYRWYQFFSGFAQNLLSDRIQGHDTFSGIKVLQQNIFGTGDEELDWSNVLAHLSQPAEADVPGFVYLLCRGDMWSPTAAGDGDTAWLTPSDPIYDYDFPAIWPADATDGRRPLLISCTAMLNRFDNALCGNTEQSIGKAATLSPAGPIGVIGFSSSDYFTEVPYTTEYPDLSTHTMNYLKSVDENEGHTMTRLEKGVLKIEREDDPETADIETAVMGKVEFVKLIAEAYQTSTGPGMGDIFNHALGDYIAAHNEDFLAQEPRVASTVFGACLLGDSALLMPMRQRADKDNPRPELSDMNPRQPVPVTGYRSTPRYNSSDMPVHVIPRYDPDHPEDNDGVDVALHITTDAEVVRVRVLTPFRQNTTYTSGYWYDAEGTLWSDWSFPAPSYADPDMDGDGDPETCATVDSQYLYAFTAYVPSIYLVIVQAQNPVWEPGDGDEWRWLQERWFYVQAVNQFVRDSECNILVVDQDQHDRYYLNGDAWGSQVEDYYVNPGYDGKGYAPGDDPRDHTPPGWGSSGWGWDAHSSLPQPALPVLNKELGEDLGKDAPFKYQYWCSNVYCTLSPNGDTIKNQQRYYGDLTPGAMKSFQDSGGIIVAFSGDLLPDGPYGYLFRYDTTCWEEAQNLQTYLDNGGRYFLTNQYMPDEAALLTVPPVTTDRLVPYIQDFQQDYLGGVTITEDSNYTSMEGLQPNTMSALINDVDIEGANGESNADRTAELDPNGLEAATVFTWYTGAGPGTVGGSKSSAIQNRILAGGGRSLYFTWPFEAIDSAGIVGSGESGRINVMRKIIEWLRNVPKAANPSPADHQMGVPRNVVLQWGEVPEASRYHVYIGTDPEDLTQPGAIVATDDPQYDPYKPGDPSEPLLDLETKYYWRVDCENPDSGMSITTGDIWTFTTAGEGPATNPFPADGATGVATDVTLSWDGTGATYDIYLGQGSLPPSPTATGLTDTEYTPAAPLTLGATYYWRVDSHMVDSTIITGATWTFTVALAGQATDPNPADLATNVPQDVTLSWTGAGVTYDIYLGQGGLPGVATAEGLTSTSYTPPADLTAGATYYWRVDTHMADTPVVPGATWTFTVIIPGAKATNPSPPDLATNVPVDAILSWTGAGVTYDIYLGRGGLPGSATATGLTSAQYTPAGTLSTGATYYWRVDSHLADLSLITGDTWTFTVIGGTAPVSGGGGGGGGGGCFIATSALSSAPCAGPASVESNCTGRYLLTPQRLRQVNNIRSLRDDLLLRLRAGRAFSAWYYALGPYAAEAIRRQEPAKAVVRTVLLDPLAKLSEKTRRKEQ